MGRPVWLNSANTADLIKAIDTMPDGFALYDVAGNLTHWNRRFVEIHPQIKHLVRIGATFGNWCALISSCSPNKGT